MIKKIIYTSMLVFCLQHSTLAQETNELLAAVKLKMSKVIDYEANATMKTKVLFLKLPIAAVKLYYKSPSKFKLKSEKGISFVPKGAMSLNVNSFFNESNFTIIDAGVDKINKVAVRVLKLLPNEDNSDLVLSTLYIDPASLLILKSRTTTKENGTYELKMKYGQYASFGLPDEILFVFNTKEYKLPKGITFDFNNQSEPKPNAKSGNPQKGEVKIIISKYQINKNISENIFK